MAQQKDFTKQILGAKQNNSRNNKQYTEEEKLEARSQMRTQGKPGCGQARINMAFTPENMEHLERSYRAYGMTKTQLVNFILSKYFRENAEGIDELINKANELLEIKK